MEQKNNFLHKKLPDLQKSEEVQDAVGKHIRVTGEKVSNSPEARLDVYMERLEKIFLNKDEGIRKRNIEMLRDKIHDAFVIRREDVPESYFELQKRVARERGEQVEEIPQNIREQMIDVIIEDQKHSLDSWVNYLSSNDAMYPTWFKYFAFRNIVKLSQFDKELGKFKERTKATTAPFPDIYREALAQVSDLYESASRDKALFNDKDFQTFLSKKFPTQYADKIQQTLEHSQESREQIEGQWVKYEKGNEEGAKKLFESLQSKGTGWCTAGQSTALTQIKSGDFYVFYTNDTEGNPTTPRLAIRMNGKSKIGEVRGVLPHQEVEMTLQETLDTKLETFGSEANEYKKKSASMKKLTAIDKTVQEGQSLNQEDLRFLYEIDNKIEGFGYNTDPRIEELKEMRDEKKDYITIFCKGNENLVASNMNNLTEDKTLLFGDFTADKQFDFSATKSLTYIKGKVTICGLNFGILSPEINESLSSLKMPSHFLQTLINSGFEHMVIKTLNCFENVNYSEIADNLITKGKASLLINNIDKFKDLDQNNIIFKIIENDQTKILYGRLKEFEKIDYDKILETLFKNENYDIIASNLTCFKGVEHVDLAEKLLNSDVGDVLEIFVKSLPFLKRLTPEIFHKFYKLYSDSDDEFSESDIYDVVNNLPSFRMLDEDIARQIVEELGRDDKHPELQILPYLPSFANLSESFLTLLLSYANSSEPVARSLHSFKNLSQDTAEYLISSGYGENVMNNISSFTNIDYSGLLDTFIRNGEIEALILCIPSFSMFRHDEIVTKILERPSKLDVDFFYLHHFKELSFENAKRLIFLGDGYLIANNITCFKTEDRERIIDALIESDDIEGVAKCVQNLNETQKEVIIKKLKEKNKLGILAGNINTFNQVDKSELLETMIAKKDGYSIIHNISSFEGIDHKVIIKKLIDSGEASAVISGINKFHNISKQEILQQLLDKNELNLVSNNLDALDAFTSSVAEILIKSGYAGIVTSNLSRFKDLSFSVAESYLNRDLGYVVARNLNLFKEINHNEIAKILLKKKQIESLSRFLQNFKGLDSSVADQLIAAGKIKEVKQNASSFTTLPKDF